MHAMKDYELTVTIRNNYLLTAMRRAGFKTIRELADASGCSYQSLLKCANLKKAARHGRTGDFRPLVKRVAEFLRVSPEMLFPVQHHGDPLPAHTATMEADLEQMVQLTSAVDEELMLPAPDEQIDWAAALASGMDGLTEREQTVLKAFYGLDGPELTLEQTGELIGGPSRERVRQILCKALAKLRRPQNTEKMGEILGWYEKAPQARVRTLEQKRAAE